MLVVVATVLVLAARPVFFLHLHKAGGTFMCGLARRNGLVINAVDNCNVQPDQRCCGGDSVAAHVAFANTTRYGFVASESYMYDAMAPEVFTYAVILRDAWARYLSHYRHITRLYRQHRYTNDSFFAWLDGQPDNWATRHLCGTRCMAKPKFALNRGDFVFAQRRLEAFAFVARLERPAEMAALLVGLSWNITDAGKNSGGRYRLFDQTTATKRMTVLDDCLYAENHTRACTRAYFDAEPTPWRLPCGQRCSKYR